MKNYIYTIVILIFLASCTTARKSVSTPPVQSVSPVVTTTPHFIESISFSPSSSPVFTERNEPKTERRENSTMTSSVPAIENRGDVYFKFGIRMDIPVEALSNEPLVLFMDEWYGTPYRFGGTSKSGIDCSSFVTYLMTAVYGLALPRNSKEQYSFCTKIRRKELSEGDLVFFKTRGKGRISHVGVYLGNNKFAHASTSSGVIISDMNEQYFSSRYAGSGRVRGN